MAGATGTAPGAESVPAPDRETLVQRLRGTLAVLGRTGQVLGLIWRAHPGYCSVIFGLHAVLGFFPLINGWTAKLLVDRLAAVIAGTAAVASVLPFILALLVGRAGVQLLDAGLGPVSRLVWQQLVDHVTRDIHRLILSKANGFRGIAFFESPRFFDLLQKAQMQAQWRPMNMVNGLTQLFRQIIALSSMGLVLFLFSPWVALLLIVATAPHLAVQFRNRREMYLINDWSIPEVRRMGYFSGLLTDKREAKEVRLFGLGQHFLGQFTETFEAFRRRQGALRLRHWYTDLALAALAAGAHAIAFGSLILAAVNGHISVGDFFLYVGAMTQVRDGISGLSWQLSSVYESNLYMGNLFEFLAVEERLPVLPPGEARPVPAPMRQGIELRNVAFSYDGGAKPVLEDVSFTIGAGQTVALVGENGAGKTTLVKLLTRLYDPTAGQILVDGVDLKAHDLEDWRKHIAVVFQDFMRYSGTARENIGLGDLPRMDDVEAVISAARHAGADSLIERLPNGYDTMLGRRFKSIGNDGADLSGGEWQRVALARAFMRAPAVHEPPSEAAVAGAHVNGNGSTGAQLLVMDEPTAALDARAEHEIYLRFNELTKGRSTLLISHRFSTVRMADHIVVLEDGRVTEQGTHEALVARGGTYARLYAMQAERYT